MKRPDKKRNPVARELLLSGKYQPRVEVTKKARLNKIQDKEHEQLIKDYKNESAV